MKEKIAKSNVQEILELNAIQKGMLYHFLKEPEQNLYNIQLSLEITGKLDIDCLKKAFLSVQSNNESFRSVFRWTEVSKPIQIILKESSLNYFYNDFSEAGVEIAIKNTEDLSALDREERFDLETLPVKIRIIKTGKDKFLLNITYHHILFDGWSNGILFKELFYYYNQFVSGELVNLPVKPAYKDMMLRTQSTMISGDSNSFWSAYLEGYNIQPHFYRSLNSPLTADKGVRKVKVNFDQSKLAHFAKENRVTQAAIIYTAYGILLQKYNNVQDVVYGATISNRDSSYPGNEVVMGNFINSIPLRFITNGNLTLLEAVKQLNRSLIERNVHNNSSLHDINQILNVKPDESIFDSILGIENYPIDPEIVNSIKGLKINLHSIYENTNASLVVLAFFNSELEIEFSYKTAIISDLEMQRFSGHFLTVLSQIVESSSTELDKLSLIRSAAEKEAILNFNLADKTDTPEIHPVRFFEKQAKSFPNQVAIVKGFTQLNHQVLNEKANQLAAFLIKNGVVKNDLIALVYQTDFEMIIATIAIFKANAACLPIKHGLGNDRIINLTDQAGCRMVIRSVDDRFILQQDHQEISVDETQLNLFSTENTVTAYSEKQACYVIQKPSEGETFLGIILSHANLVNYFTWFKKQAQLAGTSKTILSTSITSEFGYLEAILTVMAGGELHLINHEPVIEPGLFLKYISSAQISHLYLTDTFYSRLINHQGAKLMTGIRHIFISGENSTEDEWMLCKTLLPNTEVVSYKSMVENTNSPVLPDFRTVKEPDGVFRKSIKELPGTKFYVLDIYKNILPWGIKGALHISGQCLIEGYLNHDELNKTCFFTNSDTFGEHRIFNTQLVAKWSNDGCLEIEDDKQLAADGVKRSVLPERIAYAIKRFDQIADAIVYNEVIDGTDTVLCFYVAQLEVEPALIVSFLKLRLQDHQIPDRFIYLRQLPYQANGEPDRYLLIAMAKKSEPVAQAVPMTSNEIRIKKIWEEVLKTNDIDGSSKFIELGGHSLKMILMLNRIHKEFNVKIPINEMFKISTLANLAKYIDKAVNAEFKPISRKSLQEHYQLSASQLRLYFLYEFDKKSTAYNGAFVAKIKGILDLERIQSAFKKLINRHDILRTYFLNKGGELVQLVSGSAGFKVTHANIDKNDLEPFINTFIKPFDLSVPTIFRAAVAGVDENLFYLIVDMHHIIGDGISQEILIKEFMALYQDEHLDDVKITYKDYAEWQSEEEQVNRKDESKQFWLDEFKTPPTVLELPADFERPVINTFDGNRLEFEINAENKLKLKARADQNGTTMFSIILSIYNIFLSKICDENNVTIGVAVSGRNHPDLEDVVGMFVNSVPMGNQVLPDAKFVDFLSQVKTRSELALVHQDYQYESIIEDLKLERSTNRNPLFDVMFTYQNFKEVEFKIPGLEISIHTPDHVVSKFDLTLIAVEKGEVLTLCFEYSTSLFKKETVEKFTHYFHRITEQVINNQDIFISDIEILDAKEKQQLLSDFNNTTQEEFVGKTIPSLLNLGLADHRNRTALTFGNELMSYQELNAISDHVAANISTQLNGGKGLIVGMLFDYSFEMCVCMLAILKSGNAYLPLSTANPSDRNKYILEDARASLLIVAAEIYHPGLNLKLGIPFGKVLSVKELVDGTLNPLVNFPEIRPEDLAYVIYTSGTTGTPKGVCISHQNLSNYVLWRISYHQLTDLDCALQMVPYNFDGFGANFYATLLSGGNMVMIDEDKKLDIGYLSKVIRDNRVTNFAVLPRMYAELVEVLSETENHLRFVVLAGEKANSKIVETSKLLIPQLRLENEYGPTETTIAASHNGNLSKENVSDIGKPISNVKLYILGKDKQLLPLGAKGELYVSGAGVALGYLGNTALTDEKFIPNPFHADYLMYKTGDICRWRSDGNLEIIARADNQVKIRGYRVEPDEIAAQLLRSPHVTDCVVLVKEEKDDRYLVAYYVSENKVEDKVLREFLQELLPGYMIPLVFIYQKSFSYTALGKLNIKLLPEIKARSGKDFLAPGTLSEILLVKVWADVLKLDRISLNDNFFAIGGDSIKSIQVCSRVHQLGFTLSVQDIFSSQNISELALKLVPITKISEQGKVVGKSGLSPIQKWFFSAGLSNRNHFNQSLVFDFSHQLEVTLLNNIFKKLSEHHDALRTAFRTTDSHMAQILLDEVPIKLTHITVDVADELAVKVEHMANLLQSSMDIEAGIVMQIGLINHNLGAKLIIVIHHLVIDGVSWRILIEDFNSLLQLELAKQPLNLPLKTEAFIHWPAILSKYSYSQMAVRGAKYWADSLKQDYSVLPVQFPENQNTVFDSVTESVVLSQKHTQMALKTANRLFNTKINDILLTALSTALCKVFNEMDLLVDIETHGREDLLNDENINRTLGWFTTFYPVALPCRHADALTHLKIVKEEIRKVPNNGIDFLLLKYADNEDRMPNGWKEIRSGICFNFLGNFDSENEYKSFELSQSDGHKNISPLELRFYELEFLGKIINGQLHLEICYGGKRFTQETINLLKSVYQQDLENLIDRCCSDQKTELTPSDLTFKELSFLELESLQNRYPIEDVYKLSPMQSGLLYQSLLEKDSENYFEQMTVSFIGNLKEPLIKQTLNDLVSRYDVLRTLFIADEFDVPLQVVLKERKLDFRFIKITPGSSIEEKERIIEKYRIDQREVKFDLEHNPLLKVWVIQTEQNAFEFIWAHHHIIMDGWCMGILMKDFQSFYEANKIGAPRQINDTVSSYSNYISWLGNRNNEADLNYWGKYLGGYNLLATLPKLDLSEANNRTYLHRTYVSDYEESMVAALDIMAKDIGTTLNTIFQAAWGLILSRYNLTNDVVFGGVVAGRPVEIHGIESMMGLFVNTIPVRIRYDDNLSVKEVIERTQQDFADSESFSYLPLAEVQSLSTLGRDLLDHILIFENYPIDTQILKSGKNSEDKDYFIAGVKAYEQNPYDFWLAIVPGQNLQVKFNYNANVYSASLIVQIANQLKHVIYQFILQPDKPISEISVTTEEDEKLILETFNETSVTYDKNQTIVSLFQQQVNIRSAQVALTFEDQCFTYGEIENQSNQIAAHLRHEHMVGRGNIVAIICERSELMMMGLMGILKSGAAYLPIDPTYPKERIEYILLNSGTNVVLIGDKVSSEINYTGKLIKISGFNTSFHPRLTTINDGNDLCYMIYTSGSTGNPKGVMVTHGNVVNFFTAMDSVHPLKNDDCLLAITSISFDISVLELFWTLCSGTQIVIHPSDALSYNLNRYLPVQTGKIDFSLLFFSSYNNKSASGKYDFIIDSAKYADSNGFKAIWVPERHFHEFGGLYPNPVVLCSALSMVTKNIELRSGSVVAPLHDAIRIAEDWSMVDNLSGGRIGVSFASGWNPNDFVLSNDEFSNRHEVMYAKISEVKRLWKGESVMRKNGNGREVNLSVFPRPVQPEIPLWITAAQDEKTFISAGKIGANILTHFLGQDINELSNKIKLYRNSRASNGYNPEDGKVGLMLHTYVGDETEDIEQTVEVPFIEYLKSAVGLGKILMEEAGLKESDISTVDQEIILKNAFQRYYKTSSLIGTKARCKEIVQNLRLIGVNEIACLVDFGIDEDKIKQALDNLNEVKSYFDSDIGKVNKHKPVTLLQSTPSFVKLLMNEEATSGHFLHSLRSILIGGEPVQNTLIRKLQKTVDAKLFNMYGPTETTIWSAVYEFVNPSDGVSIGKPIANTNILILDDKLRLLPPHISGDLYIGGDGVTKGYWGNHQLTSERFIENPYQPGQIIYKTGDIAKWTDEGNIIMIGRDDFQVKIRGHRIELGEIENIILRSGLVDEAVVVSLPAADQENPILVGYVISNELVDPQALNLFLQLHLPSFMIPNIITQMDEFPLTPNGKIDRKQLPNPNFTAIAAFKSPNGQTQEELSRIWAEILKLDLDKITANKSFFEMGGHSLTATALVGRIFKDFGVKILLQKIFVLNSIELMAEYIDNENWIKTAAPEDVDNEFILE